VSQVSVVQLGAKDPVLLESPARLQQPLLSVIVPVYNGASFLPASLAALRASDLPRGSWELIVVDDASNDRSAEIAERYADVVVRLTSGSRGPGFARNRGAELARGEIIMFVDADVCVHADALSRAIDIFEREPGVSAVLGSYDSAPLADGLVSQYRNLLHRYVHLRDAGDAVTFWAGCGAIRRGVFARSGGFDESPEIRAVEDIDLGYRISDQGNRIVLRPEIQGRHLKRWTLWSMAVTDLRYRGIPWMRLLLSRRDRPPASLNIRAAERTCTVLVGAGFLALSLWLWTGLTWWLGIASASAIAMLGLNVPLLAWFAQQRGWLFALGTIPLRLLYYALNVVAVLIALLSPSFRRPRALSLFKTTG
jgi:glycosyltransferase involved in cell wall biosynthesis